jgi:hypothetical protein
MTQRKLFPTYIVMTSVKEAAEKDAFLDGLVRQKNSGSLPF